MFKRGYNNGASHTLYLKDIQWSLHYPNEMIGEVSAGYTGAKGQVWEDLHFECQLFSTMSD
jgi:hypothetical protein